MINALRFGLLIFLWSLFVLYPSPITIACAVLGTALWVGIPK